MRKGVAEIKEKLQPHSYRAKRWVTFSFAVIVLVAIYFLKDEGFWLRAISASAFVLFFYAVDHWFDVRFKHYHYAFIILISVASFLLSPLYYVYPQYDKIQHFFQPILVCSLVFHMVSHLKIEMKWKLVFTFFIVVGMLGLFEMGEYTLDHLFDWKLQGVYLRDMAGLNKFNLLVEPLDDTMVDLFFGVVGTCVYGILVLIYLRSAKKVEFKR